MSGIVAPGSSIAQARRLLSALFRAQDIDTPELDARLLVCHALSLDHTALVANDGRILNEQEAQALSALAVRRLGGEPIARIRGEKEFWSLTFKLSPATLVPRPDTEILVEAALAAIDLTSSRAKPLRIADLGTGSGAILLALLSELPNATGTGCDISEQALVTAAENANSLGFAARSEFVFSDFTDGLQGPFDLIVSNPPYIATDQLAALSMEVRAYDPHAALDGGVDGLSCYRRIARDVGAILGPDGVVALEIGAGQVKAVTAIFEAAGFAALFPPRCDLAGISRALVFKKLF